MKFLDLCLGYIQTNKYSVINSSINGGTSSDLLKRIMNSFTYNQNNEIIIILIGSNDTSQNIPKKVFNKNIENIFYITSKLYNRVFFCEIPKMSGIGLINYPENSPSKETSDPFSKFK